MTSDTGVSSRDDDLSRTIGGMSGNGGHPMKVTETTLSDGRELLFFDDSPEALSGKVTRNTEDHRGLPETHTDAQGSVDRQVGCFRGTPNESHLPSAGK